MLGNGQVPAPAKPVASGLELMLKSAGLGEVIEAAKRLADAQSIQKILAFADKLEGLDLGGVNDRLARIEGQLARLEAAGGGSVLRGDPEARPGPADGGPSEPGGGSDVAVPDGDRADRQPRGGGAARRPAHPRDGGAEGEG